MKTRNIIIGLSILVAACSCAKTEQSELQAPGDLVTITATLPDAVDVKGAGVKTQLSWTWNAGDKITVIGETTETFRIKDGFSPKIAEFEGVAVKGSKFTILYPGADAGDTDWNAQVQKGNDNLDHLKYQASLNDVDTYTTFSFSPEWAASHNGTLKQTGVMKLSVAMPEGLTKPDSVSVSADEAIFYAGNTDEKSDRILLNFSDCTVEDGILTAWYTTSWNEATVAPGTTLYITIYGENKMFSRDILFAKESTLKTGFVNLFTVTGSGWADDTVNAHYAGGKGTKASPWIIKTKEQLLCVAGDLVEGSVRYYKLDADIDLAGETWTHLNAADPYKKFIEFDGANHTISNLGASMFGVLAGTVKDLVLDKATVDGGTAIAGILANTAGAGTDVVISNVDIKNSSITANAYTGGLLGQSQVEFTISGCDVVNTNVSGTLAGGVVGFADCKVTMAKCSFEGGTVTSSARYAGGVFGSIAQHESLVSESTVKNATITSTKDRIGGFAGQIQQTVTVRDCKVENTDVTGTQNVGGFAGVCYGTIIGSSASGTVNTINTNTGNYAANLGGFVGYQQYETLSKCSSSATINANGANMGGLVGNMQQGTIDKCFATGDVTGTYRYVGGLVGIVDRNESHTIKDSYASGNVKANSYVGGLIGGYNNGKMAVSNCYASGNVTAEGFAAGGLVGYVKLVDAVVEKNVAWGSKVEAGAIGEGNWSSGAVVGVAFPTCTLTDNYRNPSMALTAYWVPAADYQHANVSATSPLVKQDGNATTATGLASGQDGYPIFPYHGKAEAGKTLSSIAKETLGWSADIWDFSADLPKLK